MYFDSADREGEPPPGGGDSSSPQPEPQPLPKGTFHFKKVRAIAGEHHVVGIDSDRAGGLWIAYSIQRGLYYDPDDVRVVHLDAAGAKLSEWQYLDEYTDVSGLAYDGDAVWLNYGATGTGNNHLRKLDPRDGRVLTTFATEVGIVDLDARGDQLLLSNLWNQVIAWDAATGGERWRSASDAFDDSTQRGIASTADQHLWLASAATNRILLFDRDHKLVGAGVTDQLDAEWNGTEGMQLAWDGTHVILAHNNQIVWLTK